MHPDKTFRWDDRDALRRFAETIGFGMLFAGTPDGPRVVHTPMVFTRDDQIAFHISRGNGITRHLDGANALFVISGPDGYISPDWYGLPDQVPTWNYLALEMEGVTRKLDRDGLIAQLDSLSLAQEARLAPKPAWTRDKMTPGVFDRMIGGIIGFEMTITAWRSTAKFSQNKDDAVRLRAADSVEASGNTALAHLMRVLPQ